MNIEKPYCASNDALGRTDFYATPEEAVAAACELKIAPFVVYQLMAQPIAHRLTNMDKPQVTNGKHQ